MIDGMGELVLHTLSSHRKANVYQCEEMGVFIRSYIEKMESMDPQFIDSTFLAFLQRWAVNHVQWY